MRPTGGPGDGAALGDSLGESGAGVAPSVRTSHPRQFDDPLPTAPAWARPHPMNVEAAHLDVKNSSTHMSIPTGGPTSLVGPVGFVPLVVDEELG